MQTESIIIHNENEMLDAGQAFSFCLQAGDRVHLTGDLGAGKTSFVRGVIRGLGYPGEVLSPTFSLLETYEFDVFTVVHFDLYRLQDEQELELIGFRDYFTETNVIFIEWPDRAMEILSTPDYDIRIEQQGNDRKVLIDKINKNEST